MRAALTIAVLGAVAALAGGRADSATQKTGACAPPRASAAHTSRVERALRTRHDVWGNALLNAADGPSYAAARRLLPPLLYARAPGKRVLTESGVYYIPFGQPLGARGAGSVALHVADGSQVIAERVGGRRLTILVGAKGGERYGSCVRRLGQARLAAGYQPIMTTTYTDRVGARYRQESFAAQAPETGSLVSFIRLDVDATRAAAQAVQVRLKPSVRKLRRVLSFSRGGTVRRSELTYRVRRGSKRTLYFAWINYPGRRTLSVDAARYERARRAVVSYWDGRLREGTEIAVPERRVNDAYRNLLIQNLLLTWRYSVGNPYEQFSFPESVDVAEVMGELGYPAVARSIMRTSLTRKDVPYPNWKMGKRLVGSALHYRLTGDRAYVEAANPTLKRYLDELGRQIADGGGLLGRERYSSDIDEQVLGLHSQATVWQGLRAMSGVWAETGNPELSRRGATLAGLLEAALRRAVAQSQRLLADGSLFIPARLLDREPAYGSLTEARLGSYWNLVMPYALASGLFAPGSPEASGALRYMLRHGSRLLGVVRAGAYALYGRPVFPVSGTDQVYGNNVARFLADVDAADQLVLSLYGSLATAMTPNTFVSGEAASIAPLGGAHFRSMYLPPNGASNAAFLQTLRSLLVHETRDAQGAPVGLELAFSTPRPWLRTGRRIAVRRAPTSFGPVSYTLEARSETIRAVVEAPTRRPPKTLRLRVRLPRGQRVQSVTVNDVPLAPAEGAVLGETIDLSGLGARKLEVIVRYGSRRPASSAGITAVKRLRIRYVAHDGRPSAATVVLPSWYGPAANPPLPLIISPHGRGLSGHANSILWGNLPGRGSFAVINPDARGRRVAGHSWGYAGHVADLARMPEILRTTLPWLRIDRSRIYAFGGSMGGQETLLLLARHPKLLAGAAAFSSVTDLAVQYRNFDRLRCTNKCRTLLGRQRLGSSLRRLARLEIGGGPGRYPRAFASRSPMTYARVLATSCVPLQLWWSVSDQIVVDQQAQSGKLFWQLRRYNERANVEAFVGFWIHSAEMRAKTGLPLALSRFGLLPDGRAWLNIRRVRPPGGACTPG